MTIFKVYFCAQFWWDRHDHHGVSTWKWKVPPVGTFPLTSRAFPSILWCQRRRRSAGWWRCRDDAMTMSVFNCQVVKRKATCNLVKHFPALQTSQVTLIIFFSSDVSGRPFSFSVFLFFGRKKHDDLRKFRSQDNQRAFIFRSCELAPLAKNLDEWTVKAPWLSFLVQKRWKFSLENWRWICLEGNMTRKRFYLCSSSIFFFSSNVLWTKTELRILDHYLQQIGARGRPPNATSMKEWAKLQCMCRWGIFAKHLLGVLRVVDDNFQAFLPLRCKILICTVFFLQMSSWFFNDTYEIQMSSFFG